MKKIYITLASLLLTAGVAAQNPTTYFMEGTTLRSQFNPAFAPLRGYVNIPLLGGVSFATTGNLTVEKLLYPRQGSLATLLDGTVSSAEALGKLNTNNLLGIDTRVNIIGFGAFTKNHKHFWSVDINARVNGDINLPYKLFEFLKTGKEGAIHNLNFDADAYIEAGFNYSFPLLNDKLYIGARVKFLTGLSRVHVNYDHLDLSLKENIWQINAVGQSDIRSSFIDVNTQTRKDGSRYHKLSNWDKDFADIAPVGYGLAVDLGATYDILPNLQTSLAVTDLGFISWGRKYAAQGIASMNQQFEGAQTSEESKPSKPSTGLLEFNQQEAVSLNKMINATINAGAEYNMWNHKVGFGLLYSVRFRQQRTLHNITGSVNYHPVRWFTISGSYSVVANRSGAVGFALNLCPNWINFFLATDIITGTHTTHYLPVKQSQMHITFGLGVPIGKRSHRIAAYINDNKK